MTPTIRDRREAILAPVAPILTLGIGGRKYFSTHFRPSQALRPSQLHSTATRRTMVVNPEGVWGS